MRLVSVVEAITYQRDADRLLTEAERDDLIYSLAPFAKNEASDLSHDERQALAKMAELLKKDFGG